MTGSHDIIEDNFNRWKHQQERKAAARRAREEEVEKMMILKKELQEKRDTQVREKKERIREKKERKTREIKEKQERKTREMIELLASGMTLDEIGNIHSITRERVRQLCNNNPASYKEAQEKAKKIRHEKFYVKKNCLRCGNEFEIVKNKVEKKFFCCAACAKYTPDERAAIKRSRMAINRIRSREFYHNVVKNNPILIERNRRRNREYSRRTDVKERYRERNREYAKRRYWELKNDPVRYQAHLEKERVRHRLITLKKRLSTQGS